MNTQQVAEELVTLCRQGKFAEVGEKYWSDDVLSIEPTGDNPESRGKAAARAKGEWWASHNEANSVKVEGPYINGDDFTVRFIMDVTDKDSVKRQTMDEIALYHLSNGKIAEERFFLSA
jgi:hypothetical protein